MSYLDKLRAAQERHNSWLCVGLDPQPSRLSVTLWDRDDPVLRFNQAIIEATADLVCAYKPNLGFYLQWGASGVIALERTIASIPADVPVILDCKTGDIGHTQKAWADGLFDAFHVDAFTVNPYVGQAAVLPALADRPDRALYLLAKTSNAGASQFQGDLRQPGSLAHQVIRQSQAWPTAGHLGYVVGATYPEELKQARELAPGASFLIPGIGAQGGDLVAAVRYGSHQGVGPVINASRAVIYAADGPDYATAAREAARQLRDQINLLRSAEV